MKLDENINRTYLTCNKVQQLCMYRLKSSYVGIYYYFEVFCIGPMSFKVVQ